MRSRSASVLSAASGPKSQTTSSARGARIAAQVDSATTATPPADFAAAFAGISNTSRTPRTALARVASKLFGLPPNTGQRAITAYSIPGTRTSRPNPALPSTFAGHVEPRQALADDPELRRDP